MSNDPQPDRQPQSLDLPLYVRPITRLRAADEIATAWTVNPGMLRQSADLVDPWARVHTGKPPVPTFTFLVLRPLVVKELLRHREHEYPPTEHNTDASASTDRDGNTELKVYHVLRRETRRAARSMNAGDARSLMSDAARVLRAGPPTSNETPRLVLDDATQGMGSVERDESNSPTYPMDGTVARTDRTENTSPPKVIQHVRKRTFAETESQPNSSSDSQSTIPARTLHVAHTDSPRSVAPLPLTARMTPPVRSNAARRLPALSMAAADAQSPAERETENGPAGPTAWTKSPDIDTDTPTEDMTTGVRNGLGREGPPMRVRRIGTGTQAASSGEHTNRNGHGHSHGYDSGGLSSDSPPQARDADTSESNVSISSNDQTAEPFSVDGLLDRPGALDRLVDRLHYELDRKHRRERERRGL